RLGTGANHRRDKRHDLDTAVCAIPLCAKSKAGVARLPRERAARGRRYGVARNRIRASEGSLAPAMTLIELMVALAIIGLCTGVVFSNMGPWLQQSRASRDEALLWRSASQAQLLLSELTAAAIDPAHRTISADEARFSVYLPRLAPAPVDVDLRIE